MFIMRVMIGMRMCDNFLTRYVGIGSRSDCLLGELLRISKTSASVVGEKEESDGGLIGGLGM